MKKYILPVIVVLLVLWLIFDKVQYSGLSDEFKAKQDSLVAAVDSMKLDIAEKDKAIDSLNVIDDKLVGQIGYWKNHQKVVTQYIDSSKAAVDNYDEKELITFFNKRYPKDTTTNQLPLAQPVLVSAAKDLHELDGTKEIVKLKDSVIAVTEQRVNGKDSVIALYVKKENTYKNIMTNQETQIKDWKFQYNQLDLQNKKLKLKNKFTKIGAGIVVGGLVYLMVAK
jgi:hypothetical protein